jgi:NADPH:quinone reductase
MFSLPAMMIAIDPVRPGGPELLAAVQRPLPVPAPGEVLIRVHAAGVNRPDILQRLGLYPMPPGTPSIPGLEVAGEVVALGDGVAAAHLGDPVAALVAGGGYAQYVCAPIGQCLPVPAGMSFTEAASLPETWFSVWSNLIDRARAQAGETILVHGGTSGIGVTAIDLARARGITIIVTCGSDGKCQAALGVGAHHAINYRNGDFAPEVLRLTGGRGVDVVLDMVGGDYIGRNLACLADDGRHVSIAFQMGARVDIDLAQIMRKRVHLTGSTLRPRSVAFKTTIADALRREIWPKFEDGTLQARIDRTFALADAAAAHRHMESGEHVGKIVLTVV